MELVVKATAPLNDLHGEVLCRAMDGKGFKPRGNR